MWLVQDQYDEEKALRQMVRDFVRNSVDPMAEEAKTNPIATKRKLALKAGEKGIFGIALPKEVGGGGGSLLAEGIAREEIARSKVPGFIAPSPHLKARYITFAKLAPDYLVKKWMPRYLKGESELGLASTEPGAGSDLSRLQATAVKKGGVYILNGLKGPMSSTSTKDTFLVLARTTKDDGMKGISMFFVEDDRTGFKKDLVGSMDPTADMGACILNDVEVPVDHLIGNEGGGMRPMVGVIDVDRASIPMGYLGAAMDSLEMAVEYAKNRIVWNKPIAVFEGVMFPLVKAVTKIESVRTFAYNVLREMEKQTRMTKEAAMMHWYICEVCLEALDVCIQISGAQGFTDYLPHQVRYRWTRGGLIGHGSTEIMKLTIARDIFGREIYDTALFRK